ncbi:type II toxin-antitoxin system RelE/ParE family toxin [Brachyspira sp.]|uniref:type II toxin-antitoxin system RelE/ParE family toxin n=1 Tax=Brachyspira sp. TaxID=1977261 RepID=UPI002628AC9D|nr:type II toxin-antitoxin system RelE/ParE family toxin [Brachyspira sp.]
MLKYLLSYNNIKIYCYDEVKKFIDNEIVRKKVLYDKINHILNFISNNKNPPKKLYKKLENDIWEIRYHDIRIFCYRKNNKIFFMDIMIKKRDRIGNVQTKRIRKVLLEVKDKF